MRALIMAQKTCTRGGPSCARRAGSDVCISRWYRTPASRMADFCFVFSACYETVASWQHCIGYNTASARLSELGAARAAEVSGGQLPPSTEQRKTSITQARPRQSTFPNSGSPRNGQMTCTAATRRAPLGKRDPSKDDSSALSTVGQLQHCFHLFLAGTRVPLAEWRSLGFESKDGVADCLVQHSRFYGSPHCI